MVRHVKYFLGLRYQVSGWEHLQTEGPYVIISNHQSSLDVLGEPIHNQSTLNVFDITIITHSCLSKHGWDRNLAKKLWVKILFKELCQHDWTCMNYLLSTCTPRCHMIMRVQPGFLYWLSSSLQAWWRYCRTAARW